MQAIAILAVAAAALTASTFAEAGRASVRIVNESPTTIVNIYTSPTYRTVFGNEDLLGSDTIRPGRSLVVDFDVADAANECRQDIKAVGRDGRVWTWTMNVCREVSWTLND